MESTYWGLGLGLGLGLRRVRVYGIPCKDPLYSSVLHEISCSLAFFV